MPNIESVPTMKLTKKPSRTAFGAYGKMIGTSKAGLEFGTSFMAMPWKAGTISAKIMRTPCKTTAKPAAKVPA